MDLSSYTLPELRRLQGKIEAEIRRRSDVTRRNLLKRMLKMAADEVDLGLQVLPYPCNPRVVDPKEFHGVQFLCIIAGHLSNLPGLQQEEGPFLPLFYDNGISF